VGKSILIVEDEPKSLKLTHDLLDISGYTTIQAVNGRQGIEKAKSEKPDLILMDIMMPEMNGYSACSVIKSDPVTGKIPVIMLSAAGFELNKKLAVRVGADGYLTKPIDLNELLATVKSFLPDTEAE